MTLQEGEHIFFTVVRLVLFGIHRHSLETQNSSGKWYGSILIISDAQTH